MTNKNDSHPPASVATQYFAEQEAKKLQEIDILRAQVKDKASIEPLPADYFAKQGEAELKARAQAAKEIAESQMPIAVRKFTNKAELERSVRANGGTVSDENMPVATKHFLKKAAEKETPKAAASSKEGVDMMPAAIQKFTLTAREETKKKKMALEELNNNPLQMPPGVAHFTHAV
eukprot:CAMPEP_0201667544 /NCGR_PEP_ID=MMETSP0494-20130426/15529_1 /ASSEMBLY_ACC=CAM_ASM_000839 /TAXON_ID=420259 /ORGANISM="Thalassiosira gravida, Strain GMp14c1" /LENGTH=175 /DNA_ID=CAMNT_0048147567 /DNA_START=121 /DNA_END=648 /DNA_ORIENTATION=+